MTKFFAGIFICILLPFFVQAGPTGSSTLVISQIYGDGGTTGSTYSNDFIEIYNAGTTAINLSNYSVQYSSGTNWVMTSLTSTVLQPGEYYLIKEASNGSGGIPLPTANVTGTISLHSNSGKVALVNSTSVLPNGCASASIVDLVGYGNANCFEGTAALAGSNTASIIRKTGNADTDNNSADFTTAPPNPRTSSFTLPVSINSFSVNTNGNGNELHWQLNCTTSTITFELQKAGNGLDFKNIYIETATQTRCLMPFIFTDTKPMEVNYYRLKITGIDKNISYSKVISTVNNGMIKQPLKINPTIARDHVTIEYFSERYENIIWIISDVKGKIIKKMEGTVMPGENYINLNTSSFVRGQYQLHSYTLHGSTSATKFLKL